MEDDKPKHMDPGWNDPPMLNYDKSNPPPKSRISNKRVAFPLSQPTGSPGLPPSLNLPPQINKSAIPPTSDSAILENSFGKIIIKNDKIKQDLEKLKSVWNEDKLSKTSRAALLDFFKFIEAGEKVKAEECFVIISKECSDVWVESLKYLLQNN